jgi:regulator of RNase E activity RraA
MFWKNDNELFEEMRGHLFSAVLGDMLDLHGKHHQFLMPECRPLDAKMVVCGRAMTVVEQDLSEPVDPPFGLMLRALDSLKENEVYIAAGSSPRYALWGELMTTAARARGAVGAVLAGYVRDTHGILEMNFPVFSYGSYAQDQRDRGHVIDFRVPIKINEVVINPGDIIFGDVDGVLVIPQEIEVSVVQKALEQVRKEKGARELLRSGVLAETVFRETGVL